MSILIVVAHPDDEVLGCGGTAAAWAAAGAEIRSCILSGQADARFHRPELTDLHHDTYEAQKILGLEEPVMGSFPNIKLNAVPHLELVQFIEYAIESVKADVIVTHHPKDINDDHRHTSHACQAAARLFQRRTGIKPLKSLYYMEILSSTDWTFPGGYVFQADTFYEIEKEGLEKKLQALAAYRGVMREFPHPRSVEIITGLAAFRGGQAGMRYAEAFQTAFHAINR
ncbi:MAG: PIG-L deacetylase family protein [Blastocatellia bacterium]